jgi:hypothetical protein
MHGLISFICFVVAFTMVVLTNRRRLWNRQDDYRNAQVLPHVRIYLKARNRYFIFIAALIVSQAVACFVLECIVFYFFPTI